MATIEQLTSERVGGKLKASYKRLSGIYNDTTSQIIKKERKIENLNEDLFELKETASNLEDEIESVRETFEKFCQETGQEFKL